MRGEASDGCSGAALIAKLSGTTLATGSYVANMSYTVCGSIGKATRSNALNGARNISRTTSPTLYGQIESSIQLESHRRTCCRKIGQPPKPKPR